MEYWNDGIMGKEKDQRTLEYWKSGIMECWVKIKTRKQRPFPFCHFPVFQYSIIPIFRYLIPIFHHSSFPGF
jgi:hypothetical protein